jgi:drug/metabolite transporter (DMT)-like permease
MKDFALKLLAGALAIVGGVATIVNGEVPSPDQIAGLVEQAGTILSVSAAFGVGIYAVVKAAVTPKAESAPEPAPAPAEPPVSA